MHLKLLAEIGKITVALTSNLVNGFQIMGIKLLAPSVHVKSAGSSKHVLSCIDQLQHISSSYMWVNIRRDSNQLKEYLKKKIHEKVDLPQRVEDSVNDKI